MIQLPGAHLAVVRDILRRYLPGRQVWVFGSRAGPVPPKPFADLDLVIMDPAPLTPQQHLDLKEAFEDSALPIKVDLVSWHNLSPILKENIQKQHGVIQMGESTTPTS